MVHSLWGAHVICSLNNSCVPWHVNLYFITVPHGFCKFRKKTKGHLFMYLHMYSYKFFSCSSSYEHLFLCLRQYLQLIRHTTKSFQDPCGFLWIIQNQHIFYLFPCPSPIFEEDTPSVMEIEMEDLDKWMNNIKKNSMYVLHFNHFLFNFFLKILFYLILKQTENRKRWTNITGVYQWQHQRFSSYLPFIIYPPLCSLLILHIIDCPWPIPVYITPIPNP